MTRRLQQVLEIVKQCSYPGYTFSTLSINSVDAKISIFAQYDEADTITGKVEPQTTRLWLIEDHFDKNQIVQTVFKCLMTSLEHRGREWFLYRGKSIFGPHYDVDALWNVCTAREQDAWKEGK
jgi:hypothetical protein